MRVLLKYPEEVLEREVVSKDIKTLEEENARLRNQLQLAASRSRSSSASLMGLSKYQDSGAAEGCG